MGRPTTHQTVARRSLRERLIRPMKAIARKPRPNIAQVFGSGIALEVMLWLNPVIEPPAIKSGGWAASVMLNAPSSE